MIRMQFFISYLIAYFVSKNLCNISKLIMKKLHTFKKSSTLTLSMSHFPILSSSQSNISSYIYIYIYTKKAVVLKNIILKPLNYYKMLV